MSTATPNKILFERANLKVTDTRFETGAETFTIKKISGVRIDFEKRHTRNGVLLVAGGIASLLGGALITLPLFIVLGAACVVGGAMLCFAKANGSVVLTTRGRDVKAFTSKDAALLQAITAALREAIERRG